MVKHKKIIIASVIGVVLVASGAAFILYRNTNKDNSSVTPNSPSSLDGTNYGPPTEQEKKETEQFKKDQEVKQNTNIDSQTGSTPSQQNGSANIVITNLQSTSQAVTASGFISNVFEDGGTCTLNLTLGSQKVTGQSKGITDVNKTTCPEITVQRSEIPQTGSWTATLNYSSSKITGTSASQTIQIK